MRVSIFVTALVLAAGCYNYNSLTTPSPEQGTYVAVTLTESGTQDLARYLGPNAFVLRGRYVDGADQGVVLSVSSVELIRGDEIGWGGERVTLPNRDIASVQVRELARGRTALLVGVGVIGLVATTAAFVLSGGATSPGASGPPPVKQ